MMASIAIFLVIVVLRFAIPIYKNSYKYNRSAYNEVRSIAEKLYKISSATNLNSIISNKECYHLFKKYELKLDDIKTNSFGEMINSYNNPFIIMLSDNAIAIVSEEIETDWRNIIMLKGEGLNPAILCIFEMSKGL